jgi:hypothetical protein
MEALSLIRLPRRPNAIAWAVNWLAFERRKRPTRRALALKRRTAGRRGHVVAFNGFRFLRTPMTEKERAALLEAVTTLTPGA